LRGIVPVGAGFDVDDASPRDDEPGVEAAARFEVEAGAFGAAVFGAIGSGDVDPNDSPPA
jgi:hypothetical protein